MCGDLTVKGAMLGQLFEVSLITQERRDSCRGFRYETQGESLGGLMLVQSGGMSDDRTH